MPKFWISVKACKFLINQLATAANTYGRFLTAGVRVAQPSETTICELLIAGERQSLRSPVVQVYSYLESICHQARHIFDAESYQCDVALSMLMALSHGLPCKIFLTFNTAQASLRSTRNSTVRLLSGV